MDPVCHFEIPADNIARAKKFYSGALGWKTEDWKAFNYVGVITTARGKDRLPKERGTINGGMMKRMGPVKSPVITAMVANMDAALKKVVKAGGKVAQGKMAIGDMGFAAYIKDTEGNVIGLFQEAAGKK